MNTSLVTRSVNRKHLFRSSENSQNLYIILKQSVPTTQCNFTNKQSTRAKTEPPRQTEIESLTTYISNDIIQCIIIYRMNSIDISLDY